MQSDGLLYGGVVFGTWATFLLAVIVALAFQRRWPRAFAKAAGFVRRTTVRVAAALSALGIAAATSPIVLYELGDLSGVRGLEPILLAVVIVVVLVAAMYVGVLVADVIGRIGGGGLRRRQRRRRETSATRVGLSRRQPRFS